MPDVVSHPIVSVGHGMDVTPRPRDVATAKLYTSEMYKDVKSKTHKFDPYTFSSSFFVTFINAV